MTYDYGVTLDKLINKKIAGSHRGDSYWKCLIRCWLECRIYPSNGNPYAHLDIKPGNILVRPGNDSLLLDFGAIQSTNSARINKLDTVLTAGYSPPEQYDTKAQLGAWTDIYAIGASMRTCLDNKTPIPSTRTVTERQLSPCRKSISAKIS